MAVPIVYGGMVGRADAGFPNLQRELDAIMPTDIDTDTAFVDWERMTWFNQFGTSDDPETIDRELAETQRALVTMCRRLRPNVRRWGVYNFPQCWYRKDKRQPLVDAQLLAEVDVLSPSWYGLGDHRYDSLSRCNALDVEKAVLPWVKPSDTPPTIGHILWHQIDTAARADAIVRQLTAKWTHS